MHKISVAKTFTECRRFNDKSATFCMVPYMLGWICDLQYRCYVFFAIDEGWPVRPKAEAMFFSGYPVSFSL